MRSLGKSMGELTSKSRFLSMDAASCIIHDAYSAQRLQEARKKTAAIAYPGSKGTITRKNEDIRNLSYSEVIAPFTCNERVRQMRCFVQHGNVTTYDHCLRVARLSWSIACRLHVDVDARALVAGAMLHDFYLYDWHDRDSARPRHATRHPLYAAANAAQLLNVGPKVANIIETHMWPLPPTRVPSSAEAWIVCVADKAASLQETLFMRGNDSPSVGNEKHDGEARC